MKPNEMVAPFFVRVIKKIEYNLFLLLLSCLFTSVAQAQEVPILDWAWAIGLNGSAYPEALSITTDANGNVYTTGRFYGTVDFDPGAAVFNLTSAGSRDVFVSKLDASGVFVWARAVGSTGIDDGHSISVDGAGNILAYGTFQNTVDFDPGTGTSPLSAYTGNASCFILKLDSDGNFIWARSFNALSNNNYEYDRLMATDAVGNVFVTGGFYNTGDFDPGPGVFNLTANGAEVFIVKLDVNGNFVWAKQVGGSNNEFGRSIAVDATGNVYITGNHHATSDYDPGPGVVNILPAVFNSTFILKLDSNGNYVWVKGLLTADGRILPYTTVLDPSGNIFTIGIFSGTGDFDPGAAVYNITEVGGYDDVFISKLDPNGNFVWAKSFGGVSNCEGSSIAADASGNIYSIGKFINATVDFDPGPGVENLTAGAGGNDMFIQKLDASGNLVWAKSINGPNAEWGASISVSPSMNLYTTGYFDSSPTDFDPTACTFNLNGRMFVQKLSLSTTPSPTITSFTPTSGPIGTSVTITGTNFSTTPANNVVKFFNDKTATVTASTSTSLTVTVPTGATTGKITVTVNCQTATSATDFVVGASTPPTITSFTPTSGSVGATVTITGTNFSPTPANNTVQFNGTTSVVTASTATSITTTVPVGATTGKITVTVAGNTATSATNFTVTTPLLTITSFTPASGPVTTSVTITGTNLSPTPANNTVKFNNTTATVSASTATTITTTVPSGATTGKITVTVSGNTATSATNFTVTVSTSITIDSQPQSITTCEGSTESFSVEASGAANITYQWQKFNGAIFSNISNGGGYSGTTTNTLTINTTASFGAGEYRCVVSGNLVPNVFSQTAELIVNPYPAADITVDGATLVSSPGDSYRWYQNGVEVPQALEQSILLNVVEYGSYVVDVTVGGCTSTSDEFVYLITETEPVNTGIKIYPNPFIDHLTIEVPSKSKIKIVDAIGRDVKKYLINDRALLELNDLNAGAYILLIQHGSQILHYRLIKDQ